MSTETQYYQRVENRNFYTCEFHIAVGENESLIVETRTQNVQKGQPQTTKVLVYSAIKNTDVIGINPTASTREDFTSALLAANEYHHQIVKY